MTPKLPLELPAAAVDVARGLEMVLAKVWTSVTSLVPGWEAAHKERSSPVAFHRIINKTLKGQVRGTACSHPDSF